jgi:hypothetical protein
MADNGYVVDFENEAEVDDLEENAEQMIYYLQWPFYYPIRIGMVLNERYRIEHKLGHGGFSTVWMAHDTVGRRHVALKVPSLTSHTADKELAINNDIRRSVRDSSYLSLCDDSFSVLCSDRSLTFLVFPLLGPSLNSGFTGMTWAVRMSAAKQLLQALKGLHDAGFVHRGPFLPPARLIFFVLTSYRSERRKHPVRYPAP